MSIAVHVHAVVVLERLAISEPEDLGIGRIMLVGRNEAAQFQILAFAQLDPVWKGVNYSTRARRHDCFWPETTIGLCVRMLGFFEHGQEIRHRNVDFTQWRLISLVGA